MIGISDVLDWLQQIIDNTEEWKQFYSDSETKLLAEKAKELIATPYKDKCDSKRTALGNNMVRGNFVEQQPKLNPKFPYRMEKVKWYLLFMFFKQIISEKEFDELISRIPEGC